MKSDLISVIVPVYNSEDVLKRCIDSLRRQTYSNIEILLIDDGSTDNSPILCDKEADEDYRIRVFHRSNHGPASARNYGIRQSMGEVIICMDSDDYMHSDMLEVMYIKMHETNADMAVCSFSFLAADGSALNWSSPEFAESRLIKKDEAIRMFLTSKNIEGYSWNKLIKKSIIVENDNWQDETKLAYEDMENTFKNLLVCQSVYLVDEKLYDYYQYSTSTVHATTLKKELCYIDVLSRISDIAIDYGYREGAYYYTTRLIQQYFELLKHKEYRNEKWWKEIEVSYTKCLYEQISLVRALYLIATEKKEVIINLLKAIKVYYTLSVK